MTCYIFFNSELNSELENVDMTPYMHVFKKFIFTSEHFSNRIHGTHLADLTHSHPTCCRFKRIFVGVGSALELALDVGIGFSAVDGTHVHHVHYRDGIAHLCSALDGNNRELLLHLTVCETESNATWEHFGEKSMQWGLSRYPCKPLSLIMHDRMKDIEKFMEFFPEANHLECFRHIIGNIYRAAGGRSGIALELL